MVIGNSKRLRTALFFGSLLLGACAAGCGSDPGSGDAGGAVEETGTPCETGADCASGICLSISPSGVCTTSCVDAADCVPGWACGTIGGVAGSACTCIAVAERCDGTDDDCDGLVDEGDAATLGCAGGECVAGSCGGCPEEQRCEGTCVDLSSDPANCGACGAACASGAECADGSCTCAGTTPMICAGRCVDVAADEQNCGACGAVCGADERCAAGACECDGIVPLRCDGTCADGASDRQNCGACGNACRATERCTDGDCRRVALLFGGRSESSVPFGDTWAWDGSSWERVATSGPAPRWGHGMTYDAGRDRVVLFGGMVGDRADDSTWEWDGTAWTERDPVTRPPIRLDTALAYDPPRARVVLFGGVARDDPAGARDDTWEWDGATWERLYPSLPRPSSRGDHTMAFDAARGRVMLYGGYNSSGRATVPLWAWDGTSWTEVGRSARGRSRHAMAYDSARARLVVHGGFDAGPYAMEWDGTSFSDVVASGAPERRDHAMVADPETGAVLVFGGREGSRTTDETWTWDGSSWTHLEVDPRPPARMDHAMAW